MIYQANRVATSRYGGLRSLSILLFSLTAATYTWYSAVFFRSLFSERPAVLQRTDPNGIGRKLIESDTSTAAVRLYGSKRPGSNELENRDTLLDYSTPDVLRTIGSQLPATQTNFSGVLAKPFRRWPVRRPLPCFPPDDRWKTMEVQNSPAGTGFLYLKPYKTASSTTSGVNLRIARNIALRKNQGFSFCRARYDHGPQPYPAVDLFGTGQNPTPRIKGQSFLWTIIRDPTRRAISQFFHFEVSRAKKEPSDANFLQFLKSENWINVKDYYLRSLNPLRRYDRSNQSPLTAANEILAEYDFIGITERLDESVVALAMLLRIPLADVLYLPAKSSGRYDDGGGGECTFIWKSFLSSGMKEYFQSSEWEDTVKHDLALYEAANRSLDLTINELGRERFQTELSRFRRAREEVERRCAPIAVFPCGPKGERIENTDCLWRDSGCGTPCLDEVATEFRLWAYQLWT